MKLDELEEALAKATPGPWAHNALYAALRFAYKNDIHHEADPDECWMPRETDAALIVALRSALPALLRVARAAATVNAKAADYVEHYGELGEISAPWLLDTLDAALRDLEAML